MDIRTAPELGSPLGAVIRWLETAAPLRGRGTLPSLAAVYPGAPQHGRWVGVRPVLTHCIRGTASLSIPASRGIDFRPIFGREPSDWRSRWARLEAAMDDLVALPPVELIRAGGEYWVVDGHNRVALAKQRGQLWIDADITELDIPEPATAEPRMGSNKLAATTA